MIADNYQIASCYMLRAKEHPCPIHHKSPVPAEPPPADRLQSTDCRWAPDPIRGLARTPTPATVLRDAGIEPATFLEYQSNHLEPLAFHLDLNNTLNRD